MLKLALLAILVLFVAIAVVTPVYAHTDNSLMGFTTRNYECISFGGHPYQCQLLP